MVNNMTAKIANLFPQIKWNKARLKTTGWDYDVIFLDDKYVARIPKNTAAKNRMAIDFCLLEKLKKHISADIPEPIVKDDKQKIAVYKAVAGSPISRAKYIHLTARQKTALAKKLAQFLTELHNIDLSELKACKIPTRSIVKQEAEVINLAKKINLLIPAKDKMALKSFLNQRKKLMRKITLTLTHGDLNQDHILLAGKSGRIGVIDFSDATIADPARDFAGLFAYGEQFVRAVLHYYRESDKSEILDRARLYYQEVALVIMDLASKGSPLTNMQSAKRMFWQRFR